MEEILKLFPDLTARQKEQFSALFDLYVDWNSKINVISRKDIENLYRNHVLHSLFIAKYTPFVKGSKILDLGTGGGFPGIPLAILFPNATIKMIDARSKKISVVNGVIESLGLRNAKAYHQRVEDEKERYDFVVSRAVAKINVLWEWSAPLIKAKHINSIPNGLITLKGGDLREEVKGLPKKAYHDLYELSNYTDDAYFDEKFILYVQ